MKRVASYLVPAFALFWLALLYASYLRGMQYAPALTTALKSGTPYLWECRDYSCANQYTVVAAPKKYVRLGLKPGATLDFGALSYAGRERLDGTRKGKLLAVPLRTPNGVRMVWMPAETRSVEESPFEVRITLATSTFSLLLCAFLGYRKPSLMIASLITFLAASTLNWGDVGTLLADLPDALYAAILRPVQVLADSFPILVLASFAIRLPGDAASREKRIATIVIDTVVVLGFFVQLFTHFDLKIGDVYMALSALTLIAACLLSLRYTRSVDRTRVGIVFVAIMAGGLGYAIFTLMAYHLPSGTPGVNTPDLFGVYVIYSMVSISAIPVSLAYAILRHRMFDIAFVLNRTIVYGVIAIAGAAIFAGLDWLSTSVVPLSRLEIGLSIAVAFLFGLVVMKTYGHLVAFVDSALFSKRRAAIGELRGLRTAIENEEESRNVGILLAPRVCNALALSSAAVFAATPDGGFVREAALGWPAGTAWHLLDDDAVVQRVHATHKAALRVDQAAWKDVNVPPGVAQPLLLIPILSRRKIVALVLYGAHTSGADIDPDEVRVLTDLCRAAAPIFDRVLSAQSVTTAIQADDFRIAR